MKIDFTNELSQRFNDYLASYKYYARKTIKLLNIDPGFILEVIIVNKKNIRQINRDYRNIDKVTDVISFALEDEVEGEVKIISKKPRLLGSIIICGPVAEEQAASYNHSLDREMKFLFIHGLLHLLGYDHQNKEDEEEMFSLQYKIIGKRKENGQTKTN